VVLLFTALDPPIIFTMGPVAAVRTALWAMRLPERIYITARLAHYPLLAELYSFRGHAHQMQRMVLTDRSLVTFPAQSQLTRLGVPDGERLRQLYSLGGEFAPDYFDPYQLQDGVYFGVLGENDNVVAAGGTHILDRSEHIAAIGNMYTRSDQRGQGYGSAILQAVVVTLLEQGFQTIFLNVDPRNAGARRLYQRYGFTDYCVFMEGTGVRRR
jgi:ribosomal protein S18 acetylase RimI-like enzyme